MNPDNRPYHIDSSAEIEFLLLISKYNAGEISPEEKTRLDELIGRSRINLRLFEILTDKEFRKPLQDVINNL